MRPLKIKMQYFGPYDHATVDFTKFNQHSLILISGNTGAGKTTIFDAMCYALFGQTTNDRERSAAALRSDFAPADQETSVTFVFTHQGREYKITRKPKQTLRGRQDKMVVHNQAVELIYPLNSDHPHAITKIKTADAFITNLLNLTQDQFRQIVLLPQGKFRQFLDADSNSKADLLRELFNTNRYARWAQELKNELSTRKQKLSNQKAKLQAVKETVTDLDASLALDDWQAAADQRLIRLKQQLTTLQDQADTQQLTVTNLNQQLHNQEELRDAITELTTVQDQTQELIEHQESIENTKNRVANLEWFQEHRVAYQQWQDGEKQLATWQTKAQQLATQLTKLTAAQQQAHQDYQTRLARQPQIDQLRIQVRSLHQALPLFSACDQLTQKVTRIRQRLHQALAHQHQHQQTIDQLTKRIKHLNGRLAANDDLTEREEKLGQKQRQCDQLMRDSKDLAELLTQHKEIQGQLSHQQTKLTKITAIVTKQTAQLANLKDAYARYQIARLAKDLKPGSPCPVCGSRDHPAPAHRSVTRQIVTDTQLKTVTDQLTESRDKKSRLQEQAYQATTQLAALAKQITTVTNKVVEELGVNTLPTDWDAQVKAIKNHLQVIAHHLEQQKQIISQVHQQLQELQGQLATHQQALAHFTDQVHQTAQLLAQQQAILIEKQARLPKKIDDIQTAQAQIKNWKQQIHAFEKQLDQADRRQQDLHQQLAIIQNSQQENHQNIQRGQREQQRRRQALETALHTDQPGQGWDFWSRMTGQLPQLSKLRSTIEQYQTKLHNNQARQNRLQKQVAGRPAPDLSATRHELTTAQTTLSQYQHHLGRLSAQQKQLAAAVHRVTALTQDNAASQRELNAFQTLTDVVTGNTENHLSLERYVLQSYFQEVLMVANTQLTRLTNGRYQFELSLASHGAGAKWTGLEVNVYDDNAGRVRSARTLSGGESFMASLALALALCQIIQEQSGGISIDALFIDEGFGSLDQQALTDALQALQELEGHRMIGIISHVTELEEQIPEQLRVRSVNGRSKVSYQHELPA